MTPSLWLELSQLAERHCPSMLLDFPSMIDADAYGAGGAVRRLDSDRD
jgi:hypothetical protein